jgi:hypothetical protein
MVLPQYRRFALFSPVAGFRASTLSSNHLSFNNKYRVVVYVCCSCTNPPSTQYCTVHDVFTFFHMHTCTAAENAFDVRCRLVVGYLAHEQASRVLVQLAFLDPASKIQPRNGWVHLSRRLSYSAESHSRSYPDLVFITSTDSAYISISHGRFSG